MGRGSDETGWGWQGHAECRGLDPGLFFPSDGDRIEEAKTICAACRVRSSCLTFALEHNERYGIWGGLTEKERVRLTAEARASARRRAGREAGEARGRGAA
jgi:WhiB family redox-sensing transcriptional regulator